ncbi:cleavage and polyadenylation specificity factor [Plasmodium brasilianum]|nr:cleavage and polyadenylation specificity factor [Plasmodium brasilianum]
MNYFSKTKIIIKVLGAGQTVGRSCVIVELENRRVMFDCGSHLGYKDERKYPNFNLLVKDDNYDITGSNFSRSNNRSSNNRNSNNSNSNNSNSNNSNRNSNNINSQWNVGEKNLGEADAYDILNTEVNISIVNSSISDKEKLINNLKRINEIIDCVIISHFHMDHIGALPFFTEILKYKGTIIMSYPTKALSPILLLDSCKLADMKWEKKNFERQIKMLNEKSDELLNYNINCLKKDPWNINEDNIYSCISKVVGLQINETYELGNLSITPYYAGHVLGACIYKLESNNFSIIYTGDYNTVPDKHLGSTKIPSLTPEVFISESTYATYVRPTRKASELELCNLVHECVHKGGKVLIPVFAIGRAQELSILLDDYWKKMKINYPIYFGCGLTENANKYYKIYSSWVSSSCCVPMEKRNLFNFANISPFVNTYLNENRPMVLFATPGMLHTGLSLKAFKAWSGNSKNLVILPGYCVQGTVGHKLIMGEKKIVLDPTTIINVACKIIYLSFSAHADSLGIQQLIKHVLPKNVIFVHGEKNGMEKLSKQISSHYYINSICPSLGQHCEFDFCKDNIQFLYMHYSDYKKILHKINLHIEEASSIPLAQNKDNLNKEEQLSLDLASCSNTCMIPFTTYIFYLSIRQKPFLLFFSKRVLLLYLKKRSFPIAFCRNGRTFTSERLFGKRDGGLPGGISSGMAGEVPNDMQRGSIRAPSNANQQKTGKFVTPKGNPLTNDENYNSNERGNSNKNILSSTILNCKSDDNILLLDLPCTQDEDVTTITPGSQAGKRKYTEICDNDKWLERDHLKKKNTMKIIKKEIADISDANNMKYLPNEPSYAGSNKSELNYLMRENDKSIYDYNEKHVHYSFSKKDVNSIRYEGSVGEIEKDVGKEAEYGMNKGEHTIMDDTSIAESDNGCDNRSDGESWDGESWDGENPFYKYDLGKSKRRYNIERNEDKVILPLLNLRFKESVSISYERFYNFVITFFQEILNSKNKNNVLHFGKSVIIKNVKCNDTYFFLLSFHSLRAIHDGENLLLMQWSYIDDAPESVIRKFINSVHSYNERK